MRNKGGNTTIIIIGIIFFIILVLAGYLLITNLSKEEKIIIKKRTKCGDGTEFNTCSIKKPYYCVEGTLIQNADLCGCPETLNKNGELCESEYETGEVKELKLKYVLNGKTDYI